MKKIIFLIALFTIFVNIFSQDLIILRNGNQINAKVVDIKDNIVGYKLSENLNGPMRYESTQNIAAIIYEDDYRETFILEETISKPEQVTTPVTQTQTVSSQDEKISQPKIKEPETPGFSFQVNFGLLIPFDENVQEIYKVFPSISIAFANYWKYFGIETSLDLSGNTGEPYTAGDVKDAKSEMIIFSVLLSGYFAGNSTRKAFFYVGGGLGYAAINESASGKLGGTYMEDEETIGALKLQLSAGMKIKHFFWEVALSEVVPSGYDVNLGGFNIKAGLFF